MLKPPINAGNQTSLIIYYCLTAAMTTSIMPYCSYYYYHHHRDCQLLYHSNEIFATKV